MKGILRAISGHSYGIFDKEGKIMHQFVVVDEKVRREELDPLQGKEVDFDKDIKQFLGDVVAEPVLVDLPEEEEEISGTSEEPLTDSTGDEKLEAEIKIEEE